MQEKGEMLWYVIHTYSGYENKVKASLEKMVENLSMQDDIEQVVIPEETVVEVRNGKEKSRQRKLFPGYVLVKMNVTDKSWYVVRNTKGVTGFVGTTSKPIPLTEQEVEDMHLEDSVQITNLDFQEEDRVLITGGPFADIEGVIKAIMPDKNMVKAEILMFRKPTLIELGVSQIKKLS
ncbi:transcription termination/antitermination protein NusG [Criibacterium bergeronii]|uniref:Transcription termination/antitermination protein NusG n=1 Tax=Criibacterium bergeronii TaxID=1871336 RepID=A0A1C0AEM0_9FIRM|nr:transcription termination/antitermination protein NusG [Criibacterium bergeronii]MBS6063636.1 transcription termination/antitermination factor NusG [Peptostreptococcaceae bacterium]RDY22084.1 transcription termination/antitermination factor NusG [Criibacterium bergeronii]TRW27929.1 transcription termination/antitermination factor NusG [Criibacterium bergeronii]